MPQGKERTTVGRIINPWNIGGNLYDRITNNQGFDGLRNLGDRAWDWTDQRIDEITGKYNTDMTNQSNRELAEYEWSKNLEMWNMQNEYNSPAAQMQRYKDAGLNPMLMYGDGGGASGGNATQMPKYNAPRQEYDVNPMRLMPLLQGFMDVKLKNEQADLVKTQRKNVEQQTIAQLLTSNLDKEFGRSEREISIDGSRVGLERDKRELGLFNDQYMEQINKLRQEVALIRSQQHNTDQDTSKKRQETKNLIEQKEKIVQDTQVSEATKRKVEQEIEVLKDREKYIEKEVEHADFTMKDSQLASIISRGASGLAGWMIGGRFARQGLRRAKRGTKKAMRNSNSTGNYKYKYE